MRCSAGHFVGSQIWTLRREPDTTTSSQREGEERSELEGGREGEEHSEGGREVQTQV